MIIKGNKQIPYQSLIKHFGLTESNSIKADLQEKMKKAGMIKETGRYIVTSTFAMPTEKIIRELRQYGINVQPEFELDQLRLDQLLKVD